MRCAAASVLMVLLLGGCASLSEDECRTADWEEIGYADGREGQRRAQFEEHVEACAKTGVRPQRERYLAGRERGLAQYCRAENGMKVGRRGESYRDVCPPELEPAFLQRYRVGQRIHETEQRIDRLETERRELERRLDRARDDQERRRVRDSLRDLDRRLRDERDALLRIDVLSVR